MFRISYKVKRILRKIYHFIGFISLFILFILPVYADVCTDYTILFEPPNINLSVGGSNPYYTMTLSTNGTGSYNITNLDTSIYYTFFPVDSNGDPTTLFAPHTHWVSMYRGSALYNNSGKQYYTWRPPTSSTYFQLNNISGQGNAFITDDKAYYESVTWVLVPGENTCSLPPPTPPTPPTPPSDEVYNSFLDVFLDRFSFLATNFTSNPYLFTFIGIIVSWIILELFLRILHLRGGYKK